MRERRCGNVVGNGAHRCSVFVIVVPNGERRFPATFDYGVNGESRVHEDTVSDTAPYTSDLFPVRMGTYRDGVKRKRDKIRMGV